MNKKHYQIILIFTSLLTFSGCEKFLEEKSDKRLATPTTLKEFKALLNNSSLNFSYHSMGEVSSDDLYLKEEDFNGLFYEADKRLYTWQPAYVSHDLASDRNEWYKCYSAIFVCNSVLRGIEENNLKGKEADELKGQALVFRAARYLDGVQIWSPVYDSQSSDIDLGMVLRLDPDMNTPSVRASVKETYDQIIKDLTAAVPLLPTTSLAPTLPSKSAAYGLLSRTYLVMGEYLKALENVEKALGFYNKLIDFNELDSGADFPIPMTNQTSLETIFLMQMYGSMVLNLNIAKISPFFYELYGEEDLRKQIYFRDDGNGNRIFKGTHTGHSGLVSSITTSELLLIEAECNARLGRLKEAEKTLNILLKKRMKTIAQSNISTFFTNKENALKFILEERRRELVFRGLRWMDIKRLNRDGADITLERTLNDQVFTLSPNDLKYAIALPEDLIEISNIQQNPR